MGLQEGGLGRRNKLAKQWNAHFEELLNYRAEHGHCDVPQSQGHLEHGYAHNVKPTWLMVRLRKVVWISSTASDLSGYSKSGAPKEVLNPEKSVTHHLERE